MKRIEISVDEIERTLFITERESARLMPKELTPVELRDLRLIATKLASSGSAGDTGARLRRPKRTLRYLSWVPPLARKHLDTPFCHLESGHRDSALS